ncbi:MAG: HAMP domain-containing protein [Myxococcaceae bacterium]|nr:HAMP domain-containing protein [Myxococcaceae bacterium]
MAQTTSTATTEPGVDLKALLTALQAVKRGDFSVRLPGDEAGIRGKVYDTLNEIIELNAGLSQELKRMAEVVGREGKLAQRARLPSARGDWLAMTDALNSLITDLAQPTSDLTRVIGAVARGDLSQTMSVEIEGRPLKGEFLRNAKTVNAMVEQLSSFASEVTRVAREVGTEGKLGGQAHVKGVSGTWKDLTDSVNSMASNLTAQVRNIADVTKAVAAGDLSRKITVDVRGEFLDLKDTFNTMVDQLSSFASEVTRVAREVGTEGKLGGQARVAGVSGTWRDLTDSVNGMAGNLTSQVRNIAEVTKAVAAGDLSRKITVDVKGEILELKDTINTMVDQLSSFASEVTRVAREVGTEGKLGGQARVAGVSGTWRDLTDSVNGMASNLTSQVRNIAEVTKAVAAGDLSRKITVDVKGEILELKDTMNVMVDQLRSFAAEVTRVAREVGTEGKLGGQARVEGVAGTWRDLTDNVNSMAASLTGQVRNIAEVTKAVAAGDLSRKITVEAQGEIVELKTAVNTMVDQLRSFASEVTRVAREVGIEGKLGGQAEVEGVAGVWRDLTNNVNMLASNLTTQVRNIADVTKAVAAGDLSRKITVDARGEILDLKITINTMVDQLSSFAAEVTRVAREVGTEGKLGGQARVEGIAGTWRDLTDSVNGMAGNLTSQVRNIADVTKAVAAGDLSRKITVDAKGEILELKNTINTMVDQLSSFASEVTRVALEVGNEGKLGGQARVEGVAGTWKDLTESVNFMASNLTSQVRNIADVTKAVAAGDLSRKISVDVKGEILELKNTVNVMVDQLSSFASEVTRVAREVGTEGKLGGQAKVEGVAGTWRDLTDSVNFMASNLTSQVRNIAEVTKAVAAGDLSRKITVDVRGELLELKDTINTMVDQLSSFAAEVTRVAREVGTEGRLGGQAVVRGVGGTWKDLTDSVNGMASNLTAQVRNIAEVTKAIGQGDLSRKITVDVRGEILELKNAINTMVDQLGAFSAEVIRVAREVGTEGKLGGQAQVKGVAGAWRDLTENVNFMASNLTDQVRGIAAVVTAVANGDLKRKLALEARGEIAALAETINGMIDTLATFADQVTTVAREVGIEGKLGGQARVPSAAGTWRDLTDNVNSMAQSLTLQVRAIAEVATAVAQGDLTRSIQVAAQGEVAALKDNINQMIANLRETTRKNTEQDWLKTNVARMTRMLQGQRDMDTVSRLILKELAPLVRAQTGAFYLVEGEDDDRILKLVASYAFKERKHLANRFKPGEGLIGQVVLEKERILLTDVPGDYITISSGLGETRPLNLVVVPVLFEGDVRAVIELASLYPFTDTHLSLLDQLTESIGVVLNTIGASTRTEELLRQSQGMAEELRTQQAELTETNKQLEAQARTLQASEERLRQQQEELQQTNEELEERSRMLQIQNEEVERKNSEIEQAKRALEEKAEQLALTSRYKSEFLANMSHELRTPLNSLLILSRLLAENAEGNLTEKQVEFARTINTAGSDLLALINDILDLSKIESGTMTLDVEEVDLASVREQVLRTFREVANSKNLEFDVRLDPRLPRSLFTDARRLHQVLKNLLSNAFKFTERGSVILSVAPVTGGWSPGHPSLSEADEVLAFSVQDTGIGIPKEKQQIIFEAFQQADGTTNRRYGGTGLGLSISRELSRLLGGEIRVESEEHRGSTFTLYLPRTARVPRGQGPVTPEGTPSPFGGPRPTQAPPAPRSVPPPPPVPEIEPASEEVDPSLLAANDLQDDRDQIRPGDRTLLIIEDDPIFARLLLDLARENGFKGLVALRGDVGLALARRHPPDAITLDLLLPAMDGWMVLDRLKHDPKLRHIPVHIISGVEAKEDRQRGLKAGAMTVLTKPVDREALSEALRRTRSFIERPLKTLLIVEDDERQRNAVVSLIGNGDVKSIPVSTGREALEVAQNQYIDCVVIDLGLPDMTGVELIHRLRGLTRPDLPVIVYTGRELTEAEETELRQLADSIIVKSARSPEHLLDETSLFLHRVESNLPESKRRMLRQAQLHDPELAGKKVLVVDDDARNLFAIASILERYHVEVLFAENGRRALELVDETPDLSVVLMDVMMPEMDGYETMRAIRARPEHAELPIIAVTAKAMKDDREKCIQAGASDYITKPVDPEQLISILRVWAWRRKHRSAHA